MIRKEETIRQLERSRDLVRAQIDRLGEAAFDRDHRAGGEAPSVLPRSVVQRLDAIQRELAELRREIRGLKDQPKE